MQTKNTLEQSHFQINFDLINPNDLFTMPYPPVLIVSFISSSLWSTLIHDDEILYSCCAYFIVWLCLIPDIIFKLIENLLEIPYLFLRYLCIDLIVNIITLTNVFLAYRSKLKNPKHQKQFQVMFDQEPSNEQRQKIENLNLMYLVLVHHFNMMLIYQCLRCLVIEPILSILSILMRTVLLPLQFLYCASNILFYYGQLTECITNDNPRDSSRFKLVFSHTSPSVNDYLDYFNNQPLEGFKENSDLFAQYEKIESSTNPTLSM
ncbi:MAG: hypothetical protein CBD38_02790 [bacterium TMED178]|nr:MAG: hypothetical protein CBD38_02790 [bacterium TMED178]